MISYNTFSPSARIVSSKEKGEGMFQQNFSSYNTEKWKVKFEKEKNSANDGRNELTRKTDLGLVMQTVRWGEGAEHRVWESKRGRKRRKERENAVWERKTSRKIFSKPDQVLSYPDLWYSIFSSSHVPRNIVTKRVFRFRGKVALLRKGVSVYVVWICQSVSQERAYIF